MQRKYCQPRQGFTNAKHTNYYTLQKVTVTQYLNTLPVGAKIIFTNIANATNITLPTVMHIVTDMHYKNEYPLRLESKGNRRVFYK